MVCRISGTPGRYKFCAAGFKSGEDPATAVFYVQVGQTPNPNPGPGPDPGPNPEPSPEPPRPDGLAGDVFDVVRKLPPEEKQQIGGTVVTIFRSVSSKAAGIAGTTPSQMLRETNAELKEKLTSAQRTRWDAFNQAFNRLMKAQGLASDDKLGHIEAWDAVANGVEAALK